MLQSISAPRPRLLPGAQKPPENLDSGLGLSVLFGYVLAPPRCRSTDLPPRPTPGPEHAAIAGPAGSPRSIAERGSLPADTTPTPP